LQFIFGNKVALPVAYWRRKMEPIDRDTAKNLYEHYRKNRDGIRNKPEMATVCLICGSIHVGPDAGDELMLVCRNCGFAFYRYLCRACGKTVDGRDPMNPACRECGLRTCTCGACGCSAGKGIGERAGIA
jgi:hypothetical protein